MTSRTTVVIPSMIDSYSQRRDGMGRNALYWIVGLDASLWAAIYLVFRILT